jgi:hypothetical protein
MEKISTKDIPVDERVRKPYAGDLSHSLLGMNLRYLLH